MKSWIDQTVRVADKAGIEVVVLPDGGVETTFTVPEIHGAVSIAMPRHQAVRLAGLLNDELSRTIPDAIEVSA